MDIVFKREIYGKFVERKKKSPHLPCYMFFCLYSGR